MSDLGHYLEETFLNWLFNTGATQPTQPTSTEVALHTGDPGEDGTQNEVPGTSWDNYGRVTVNNDGVTQPFWRAAVASVDGFRVDNNGQIDFGTATVSGADVQVSHVTVWDHLGNLLYQGPLASTKTVQDGDPVRFADGELDLDLL